MSIPTSVMLKLATIGLSSDQAEAVADMLAAVETATEAAVTSRVENALEVGREKARARWHRWDDKRRSNVGKRLQTAANVSGPLAEADAPVEDKTSYSENPQEENKTRGSRDVDAFRAALSSDVPFDLISEFIKVRRKKRGAITGYAAALFREDAAKVGMSVADAAKECVRSSWITVKPEYFHGRQREGPPALGKPPSQADVFKFIRESGENGRQEFEDRNGSGAAISYLPAVGSR